MRSTERRGHRVLVPRGRRAHHDEIGRELTLIAERAPQRRADVASSLVRVLDPGGQPERRIVANVLSVMAVEPRHPVADVIGLEGEDLTLHRGERTAGTSRCAAAMTVRTGASASVTTSLSAVLRSLAPVDLTGAEASAVPRPKCGGGRCVDSPPWGCDSWMTSSCSTSATRRPPWPGSYLAELGATVVRVEDRARRRAAARAARCGTASTTPASAAWRSTRRATPTGPRSRPRSAASTSSSAPSSRTPATARFLDRVIAASPGRGSALVDVVFRRDAAARAGHRPDARRRRRLHGAQRVVRGPAEPGRRRPGLQAGRAGCGRGGAGARHGAADHRSGRSHRRLGPGGGAPHDVPDVQRQPLPLAPHRAEPPRADRRRIDRAERRRAVDLVHHPPAELPALRRVGQRDLGPTVLSRAGVERPRLRRQAPPRADGGRRRAGGDDHARRADRRGPVARAARHTGQRGDGRGQGRPPRGPRLLRRRRPARRRARPPRRLAVPIGRRPRRSRPGAAARRRRRAARRARRSARPPPAATTAAVATTASRSPACASSTSRGPSPARSPPACSPTSAPT